MTNLELLKALKETLTKAEGISDQINREMRQQGLSKGPRQTWLNRIDTPIGGALGFITKLERRARELKLG